MRQYLDYEFPKGLSMTSVPACSVFARWKYLSSSVKSKLVRLGCVILKTYMSLSLDGNEDLRSLNFHSTNSLSSLKIRRVLHLDKFTPIIYLQIIYTAQKLMNTCLSYFNISNGGTELNFQSYLQC